MLYIFIMSDLGNNETRSIVLSINNKYDLENIRTICRALSSSDRLRILNLLSAQPMNLYQLSVNLAIPISSVANHIAILQNAGIIMTTFKPTKKGHEKLCSKAVLSTIISFDDTTDESDLVRSVEMPIGLYNDCQITAPCGILSATKQIGQFDNPEVFWYPERHKAELIWFNSGYVSYIFPNKSNTHLEIQSVVFSFEICSESPYYNNNWKSDITISVNDVEIATIQLPGDFGGRRGNHTPTFWNVRSTQFGLLKSIKINNNGVYYEDKRISRQNLDTLQIANDKPVKLQIAVKDTAEHIGGINIFGSNFGDYPQSIKMTTTYQKKGNNK